MFGRLALFFEAIGSPAGSSALAEKQRLEQIIAAVSRTVLLKGSERAAAKMNDLIIEIMADEEFSM